MESNNSLISLPFEFESSKGNTFKEVIEGNSLSEIYYKATKRVDELDSDLIGGEQWHYTELLDEL